VFEIFSDRLEPFAPIPDPALCLKIVKAAITAWHAAVSAVVGCSEGVASSSYKATKTACATAADPKACATSAKTQLELDRSSVENDAADADPLCDQDLATTLAEHCVDGFPG